VILTVTVPDELEPYLTAAAAAAGAPDLAAAVAAHLAGLIRESARRQFTDQAMQTVGTQVAEGLAAVDQQNALIEVSTS
jgi:hypothetical protein